MTRSLAHPILRLQSLSAGEAGVATSRLVDVISGQVHGLFIDANPLQQQQFLSLVEPDVTPGVILSWSGTLGEDLQAREPRNWLVPGRRQLDNFCDQLLPQLQQRDLALCLRPHSRHILSDVPSTVQWLLNRTGQPFAIAIDIAGFFEPEMLEQLDDHLERIFSTLGNLCRFVILSDMQVTVMSDQQDRSGCRDGAGTVDADRQEQCIIQPRPLGEGVLSAAPLRELIAEFVPQTTPLVLLGDDASSQIDWLEKG